MYAPMQRITRILKILLLLISACKLRARERIEQHIEGWQSAILFVKLFWYFLSFCHDFFHKQYGKIKTN